MECDIFMNFFKKHFKKEKSHENVRFFSDLLVDTFVFVIVAVIGTGGVASL